MLFHEKGNKSIVPHLYRVLPFVRLAGWDVESDLHEGDFCVVILVKFQSDFILPCGALGNVGQRDLKRRVFIDIERQQWALNGMREGGNIKSLHLSITAGKQEDY